MGRQRADPRSHRYECVGCLRRLEQQNTHETARRVLRYCSQTLRYAIITGRAETDVLGQLRGALAPRKTRHLASVKEPQQVGALLKAIDGYDGRLVAKFALRFAPLVFVRPHVRLKTVTRWPPRAA